MSSKQARGRQGLPTGQQQLSFGGEGPAPKRPKLSELGNGGLQRQHHGHEDRQPQSNALLHRDATGSSFTACPVCGKHVPLLCINLHLDLGCAQVPTPTAVTAAAPGERRSRAPARPVQQGTEPQSQRRAEGKQALPGANGAAADDDAEDDAVATTGPEHPRSSPRWELSPEQQQLAPLHSRRLAVEAREQGLLAGAEDTPEPKFPLLGLRQQMAVAAAAISAGSGAGAQRYGGGHAILAYSPASGDGRGLGAGGGTTAAAPSSCCNRDDTGVRCVLEPRTRFSLQGALPRGLPTAAPPCLPGTVFASSYSAQTLLEPQLHRHRTHLAKPHELQDATPAAARQPAPPLRLFVDATAVRGSPCCTCLKDTAMSTALAAAASTAVDRGRDPAPAGPSPPAAVLEVPVEMPPVEALWQVPHSAGFKPSSDSYHLSNSDHGGDSSSGGGASASCRHGLNEHGLDPGPVAGNIPLHPMFLPRGAVASRRVCTTWGPKPACRQEGAEEEEEAARAAVPEVIAEAAAVAGEMRAEVSHPALEGQYLVLEFVTPAEEAELLAMCDDPVLKPSWSPWIGQMYGNATAQKTRGKRWGVLPDYHRRGVAPVEHPLPPLLRILTERMRVQVGLLRCFQPNEANAIDYWRSRGSWLRPHVDDRILSGDLIVNLSLGGAAVMTFARERDKDEGGHPGLQQHQQQQQHPRQSAGDEVRVRLAPRSLQILSRAARYSYTHAIAASDLLDARRVSITFRRSELRPFERAER
ncbi:hypothetical protein VOLCADRAFT_119009 [Volvox carteri f. nagariensis]|uniref:Fe2OG dioxygenase domain-containing protein n=1 Tax=Volvox carteri f. nagariensis TaxID=3068 RepID=D8U9C3_VOLCA|nr:uncharacterized protein VOLCADRAFT_119009 [Volvox carteri f. nagariensis]EFJ43731.1 hypothetical protein VOLCADRAFT_119009 [Volvox carteri f. nagariensis]|eukprot:XP_002955212.1 hypothetical protein VOLCADRAFT_119009 [Volvox carteri f. nagariensis]